MPREVLSRILIGKAQSEDIVEAEGHVRLMERYHHVGDAHEKGYLRRFRGGYKGE